jgi:hypothetical protein
VAAAFLVDDHGHAHGPARQPPLDEDLALEKLDVLAVAGAVLGQVPAVLDPPMVAVGHRLDALVDVAIDENERLPDLRGECDRRPLGHVDAAFGGRLAAELHPGPDRLGAPAVGEGLAHRWQCGSGLGLDRVRRGEEDESDERSAEQFGDAFVNTRRVRNASARQRAPECSAHGPHPYR